MKLRMVLCVKNKRQASRRRLRRAMLLHFSIWTARLLAAPLPMQQFLYVSHYAHERLLTSHQLVFNLTNAEAWVETFNGFNFIAFYNFLVDYFEERCDTASRRQIDNLLAWWNRYVLITLISPCLTLLLVKSFPSISLSQIQTSHATNLQHNEPELSTTSLLPHVAVPQ